LTQLTNVTDTQTPHDGIGRASCGNKQGNTAISAMSRRWRQRWR